MDKEIQVLVIEDDANIAEINRRFVEKVSGYQVIGIALDEQQAKEQLSILQPDLVLLDIYFPNANGLDLLAFIQEHYAQTDVIMVTAAKDIDTVRTALKKGAFDFIVKPIIFDRFKETLVKYLQFRERLDGLSQQKQQVDQQDIDQLLRQSGMRKEASSAYPKGIDKLTLDKVLSLFGNKNKGFSADQVGKEIGISRTTARRYLEYLVSIDQITADLVYGEIGRPERIYKLKDGRR